MCHVLYCGKKIYTFVYTGFNPATGRTNTKIKHLNEYSAAIFAKEELAWAEKDRVHHINIHDIDKQKENEALITLS